MKRILILILATASCVLAQERGNVIYQSASVGGMAFGGFDKAPIQGAPYSATVNNESIQTLADGNRIVQSSTGTTARDSQGRTRHDTALPAIGNLSAANAPRLVFLQDPVAQTSYTLNLTEKTAQKMPVFSAMAGGTTASGPVVSMKFGEVGGAPAMLDPLPSTMAAPAAGQVFIQKHIDVADGPVLRVDSEPNPGMMLQKHVDEQASATTEDLGSQTMEGVPVNGVRTTHTIPAGQIGNERPITIVTEIWVEPLPVLTPAVTAAPVSVLPSESVAPPKTIRRRRPIAPLQARVAKWQPAETAVQITIPAETMFAPGAIPEGMNFVAELSIGPDGSVERLRLRP